MGRKKQYQMAKVAAESYIDMFRSNFIKGGYEYMGCIQRAYVISCKLGIGRETYAKCCAALERMVSELDKQSILPHLIPSLMQMLQENNYGNQDWGIQICERIISEAIDRNDIGLVEIGIDAKIAWLKYPPQNNEQIKLERIRLGKAYESTASYFENKTVHDAIDLYEKAILAYRQQRCHEDEIRIRKLVEPLKKKLAESLIHHSYSIDATETIHQMNKTFEGRSLPEQLALLAMNVGIQNKQELIDIVLDRCKSSPISAAFTSKRIDSDGKTIIEIPPIDLMNPLEDQHVLELNMWNNGLLYQSIYGQMIWNMICLITEGQHIDEQDIDFLFENNAFIPQGSVEIFNME